MRAVSVLLLLAAAAAALPARGAPEVSFRLLAAGERFPNEQVALLGPQLYLELTERPVDEMAVILRAAAVLGPALVPVAGTLDATVRWTPAAWAPGDAFFFTFFPLGSSKLELGYDPLLRLGSEIPRQSVLFAAKAGLSRGPWSGSLAMKSAQVPDDVLGEPRRRGGFFAEGAWSSPRSWKLGLSAALLPVGPEPGQAALGFRREVLAVAGAARVIYRSAGEIGAPLDYDRLRRTPWGLEWLLAPRPALPPLGVELLADATVGQQWLADPGQAAGAPLSPQALYGWSASARLAFRGVRVQLGALGRSASLVLADRFGAPPYTRFLPGTARHDDLWLVGSADLALLDGALSPGLLVRFRRPAAFTAAAFPSALPRTVVIDELEPWAFHPDNAAPRGTFNVQLSATWRPAPFLAVLALGGYAYDPNQVRLVDDPSGNPVPVFTRPYGMRVVLAAQVRL